MALWDFSEVARRRRGYCDGPLLKNATRFEQLKDGGRLVMPVGGRDVQTLKIHNKEKLP